MERGRTRKLAKTGVLDLTIQAEPVLLGNATIARFRIDTLSGKIWHVSTLPKRPLSSRAAARSKTIAISRTSPSMERGSDSARTDTGCNDTERNQVNIRKRGKTSRIEIQNRSVC